LRAEAERVKAVAQQALFDPTLGTFGPRRQVNAMAVFAGVANEEQTRAIYDSLLGQPVREGDRVTPYYNYYVLEAMAAAGHHQAALDFIRAYWGEMLARGATTWWEIFDPRDKPAREIPGLGPDWHGGIGYNTSLSHGWGSGPTAWLSRYVLGIWPTAPGFAQVEIVPHLGDLEWARGTVPTPRGVISVEHERKERGWLSEVELPAGIVGWVGVPRVSGEGTRLRLNGKEAVVTAQKGDYLYVALRGKGHYRLEAE